MLQDKIDQKYTQRDKWFNVGLIAFAWLVTLVVALTSTWFPIKLFYWGLAGLPFGFCLALILRKLGKEKWLDAVDHREWSSFIIVPLIMVAIPAIIFFIFPSLYDPAMLFCGFFLAAGIFSGLAFEMFLIKHGKRAIK